MLCRRCLTLACKPSSLAPHAGSAVYLVSFPLPFYETSSPGNLFLHRGEMHAARWAIAICCLLTIEMIEP